MLLAIVLALLLITPAEAHATLVRSEPSPGALLTTVPKELVLEFSERLDPIPFKDTVGKLTRDTGRNAPLEPDHANRYPQSAAPRTPSC